MADRLVIQLLDDELQQRLASAISQLEQPAELMEAVAGQLKENVELRFITKTDPNGVPWKPLAESTLARKKGKGSILELSGHMKDSLDSNVAPDGAFAEVGFGEAYAGYHETGSKVGERPPQRALLAGNWQNGELGEQDRADVLGAVDRFLADLL